MRKIKHSVRQRWVLIVTLCGLSTAWGWDRYESVLLMLLTIVFLAAQSYLVHFTVPLEDVK